MANVVTTQIDDVLISPLEQILFQVGRGVAKAQQELDINSIRTQTLLESDPVLAEFGLQATWYHMPEVELEMKMALNLRFEDIFEDNKFRYRRLRMYGSPYNAAYQNNFKAEVSGTSQIKAKIVSIPPQRATE